MLNSRGSFKWKMQVFPGENFWQKLCEKSPEESSVDPRRNCCNLFSSLYKYRKQNLKFSDVSSRILQLFTSDVTCSFLRNISIMLENLLENKSRFLLKFSAHTRTSSISGKVYQLSAELSSSFLQRNFRQELQPFTQGKRSRLHQKPVAVSADFPAAFSSEMHVSIVSMRIHQQLP